MKSGWLPNRSSRLFPGAEPAQISGIRNGYRRLANIFRSWTRSTRRQVCPLACQRKPSARARLKALCPLMRSPGSRPSLNGGSHSRALAPASEQRPCLLDRCTRRKSISPLIVLRAQAVPLTPFRPEYGMGSLVPLSTAVASFPASEIQIALGNRRCASPSGFLLPGYLSPIKPLWEGYAPARGRKRNPPTKMLQS
jgi:hypothetical protein